MAKTLMIIFGVLALITIGVIGGGYWWWTHSGAEFFKETEQAYADARKAGASMDEQACYDRSVAILKSNDGQSFGGSIRNIETLKGCLQTSKVLPAFCNGVPAKAEILAGLAWEVDTCAKLGGQEEYCKHVVREVPTYCSSQLRAAKLAKGG